MSRARELADFLVASGNQLELKGDAGEDGCIKKNSASGRDELQIYSGSDAYSTGSKGAGIHLYGNSDSQHNGDMAFLTGPNDNGNARIIVSGNEDKAHVTIGNSTASRSIWDYVDLNEDPALLNLKDASSQPALYIKGASASEGDITCPPADAMQFGHWDITASSGSEFTERFRMDTSGNLKITDGNLIVGTAGHGIDFSATANSSGTMSNELLDDYEEGTFTPQVLNGWGVTSPTYSYNLGYYTKIGDLVYIRLQIVLSGGSVNGNQLKIYGFPFTPRAIDAACTGYFTTASSNAENAFLQIVGSSTTFNFQYRSNTGITSFDGTFAGSSFNFIMSGVYKAA